MFVAVAAATLGVASSQGWQRPPSSYDPYVRPAVASIFPDAATVRTMVQQDLIPISAGPPMDRGFISLVPAARDYRRITLVGAWEQTWVSADELTVLTIRVIELRRREYAPIFEAECRTTAPLSVTPPVLVAGPEVGDGAPSVCALAQAGRALVTVRVTSTSTDQTGAVVQEIAQTLSSRVPPESDLPPGDRRFTTARGAMLRSWVIALLLLAIVSTVPTLLFDRATRERLLAFRRRRRRNPHHIDIELPAGFQILRERTVGLARLALLIWAVRLGEITYQGTYATWALVGCAYVASLLAERFVLRRSSHRRIPRHFRGRSLAVVIVGAVLSLGILIAAGFVWTLGNTIGALGAPHSPDWATGSSSLLFQLTAFVMVAYAVLPLSIARRIGMRLLRNPRFAGDIRPVLLLRSFVDDGIEMRVRRLDRAGIIDRVSLQRIARFEQVAVVALSRLGPVVAVATPGERMPPGLGAVRQQFSHEEWQHGVSGLATQASLIVMTAGRSEGLSALK